jgi:CRISPR/Cas system-associated exonuclease Cas4 (RecB family)
MNIGVNPLGLTKRPKPYAWVTWISPYLAGESQCKFALWNQSNFFNKSSGDMPSDWLVKHQSLLSEVAYDLRSDGYEVEEEDANSLHLMTSSGVTLAGKPDIVALNGQGMVVDVKTGKPRGKDRAQVNLYQALIPSQRLHGINDVPWGKIVYSNGEIKMIAPDEVDDRFKESVKGLMSMIAQPTPPDPTPSWHECRFCKCQAKCPSAQTEAPEAVEAVSWL